MASWLAKQRGCPDFLASLILEGLHQLYLRDFQLHWTQHEKAEGSLQPEKPTHQRLLHVSAQRHFIGYKHILTTGRNRTYIWSQINLKLQTQGQYSAHGFTSTEIKVNIEIMFASYAYLLLGCVSQQICICKNGQPNKTVKHCMIWRNHAYHHILLGITLGTLIITNMHNSCTLAIISSVWLDRLRKINTLFEVQKISDHLWLPFSQLVNLFTFQWMVTWGL